VIYIVHRIYKYILYYLLLYFMYCMLFRVNTLYCLIKSIHDARSTICEYSATCIKRQSRLLAVAKNECVLCSSKMDGLCSSKIDTDNGTNKRVRNVEKCLNDFPPIRRLIVLARFFSLSLFFHCSTRSADRLSFSIKYYLFQIKFFINFVFAAN
jgi:hypothetical protein